MKTIATLIFSITLTFIVKGQTLSEKIALGACEYLDSIDNFQVLQDSINPSIARAMAEIMGEGNPEETKVLSNTDGIKKVLKESFDMLPNYCYNVRRLIIEDKKSKFYKLSDNQQANIHFEQGNELMKNGDFKNAIKAFKLALKIDNNFVYAIDHLAISYRRLEDFKLALKYYKQSLDIFPEGDIALLNIAVLYSLIEDYDNSIKSYSQMKFLFPDNPEGYFGLARLFFIKEDYENALDNIFAAHRIYVNTGSDYVKDSEQLLGAMIVKFKELNMMNLVHKKAKEHNITITE